MAGMDKNLNLLVREAAKYRDIARRAVVAELQRVANISDFGRTAELPRRTLVRIVSGTANPSPETVEQIARGLTKYRRAKRLEERLEERRAAPS